MNVVVAIIDVTVIFSCVSILLAQTQPDPISNGAGWVGTGLLSTVLLWLFSKHLPDKDKQLNKLVEDNQAQISKLIEEKDKQTRELIDGKDRQIKEIADAHRDATKAVVKHCQEETKNQRESDESAQREILAMLQKIYDTGREAVHATRNLDNSLRIRQRLADALQSMEAPAWTKLLDGTLTSWNSSCERVFGWKQGEIVGKSIFQTIIPRDRLDEEHEVLSRIMAGETINEYETERMHKTGRRVTLIVLTSPIRDQSGKVIGASTIGREVT